MNKRMLLFTLLVVVAVGAVVGIALLLKPGTLQANGLRVTASAGFWGNIAAQIGGDHVQVTSILDDPEADPHLYETGARDASAITKADAVIANGLGYDDFIDNVLKSAPNTERAFLRVADVLEAKQGDNPHLWYDVTRISGVAEAIADIFSQKDPAHAASYAANLQSLIAALQPLQDRVATIHAAHKGVPIAYTERVPEYLLLRAGLSVRTPPGFATAIEEGIEPSPSDYTAMRNLITKKQIRVLVYNPQAESQSTQQLRDLAIAQGVPVVDMTETAPAGKNFQDWHVSQLDALLGALNNKP